MRSRYRDYQTSSRAIPGTLLIDPSDMLEACTSPAWWPAIPADSRRSGGYGIAGASNRVDPDVYRAPVAQLDRAAASEAVGQKFESSRAHHFPKNKLAPGIDCDGACALAGETPEESGSGLDGGPTVGADALLVAVVEKDVGAGVVALGTLSAAGDVLDDALGRDWLPVVTHRVPLDDLEAELFGGAEDHRAPGAVGRPKIVYRSADGVFESLVAGAEFFADDAGGEEAQPGMGLSVVADKMTGSVDAANDLGALANEAANHEEAGAGVVLGQELEKLVGRNVVRPVVVGEGNFVGVVARDDGVAEELRAGAKSSVGEGEARGDGHGSGCRERRFERGERGGHGYFFRSASTSSAWPSGLTLLNSWMRRWSGPMT